MILYTLGLSPTSLGLYKTISFSGAAGAAKDRGTALGKTTVMRILLMNIMEQRRLW